MGPPAALLLLAGLGLVAAPAAAGAVPRYQARVVDLGTPLANPRGMTFGPDGRLFLTEAGSGGNGAGGGCLPAAGGTQVCYGSTGALGVFDPSSGSYSRLRTDLPSLARQGGNFGDGRGLQDLSFDNAGNLYGVFGLGGNPAAVPAVGSNLFGQTVTFTPGSFAAVPRANIAAFEAIFNPDQKNVDSNPFSLVLRNGITYVSDAGGNTLLQADASNTVSLVKMFPPELVTVPPPPPSNPLPPGTSYPAEAVPTGLAIGSDDALYIGELSGFPFVNGTAEVYRYAQGGTVTPFAGGFNHIVDIAAGPDDALYVLDYSADFFSPSATGSLWRLGLDGSKERIFEGLLRPTGLAVAADGSIYVANNGDGINGQLLHLTVPVPGPLPLAGLGVAWVQARALRRRLARRDH